MDLLSSFSDFAKSHWLLVAFLAPMLWALVNMVDVYFVGNVYQDELDGSAITGLFQLIPLLAIFFFVPIGWSSLFGFQVSGNIAGISAAVWQALAGGLLFNISIYFYFKALFHHNDAALLQIIWSLTIVFVPVLSFLFWREQLPLHAYLGMIVTLFGVIILSISGHLKSKLSRRYLGVMISAVFFLSLSMVFSDMAYTRFDTLFSGASSFLAGFSFFSLGGVFGGIVWMAISRRNHISLIKKYLKVFLAMEVINLFGLFFSQKAINVAPSVSYVAVAETFVPVFVLVMSAVLVFVSLKIVHSRSEVFKLIYREQLNGVGVKILATVIMAVGVYLLS